MDENRVNLDKDKIKSEWEKRLCWQEITADEDSDPTDGISGVIDVRTSCLEHAGFDEFAEARVEDFAKASRWGEILEQYITRAWYERIMEHNREIRRVFHRKREVRRQLETKHPRHGVLLFSGELDTSAHAIEALRKWHASERTIAVLSGPPGTGKTTAAAWWMLHHAETDDRGRLPEWIAAVEFARSSRYDADRAKLLESHALVLDDLGVEFADQKGSLRTDIDELVDTFYGDMRRLVITTNLSGAEFQARYGERVTDRLAEAGLWLTVTGKSRRGGGR